MSGLLINERFVAVFPSLVRLLGSIESAVILQHLHFNADETGDVTVPVKQISDETGIGVRTVERRLTGLRDEGYVTARRSGSFDATLTYRIDHARLSGTIHANAGLESANLAVSEPANLADSSSKNVRTTTPVVTEESQRTVPTSTTGRPIPPPHGRCLISNNWVPSRTTVQWLAKEYPTVDTRALCNRFVFHYASTDTRSTNWESKFMGWVADDFGKQEEKRKGGTDEFGNPLNQKRTSKYDGENQPGDEGYFDPLAYLDEINGRSST